MGRKRSASEALGKAPVSDAKPNRNGRMKEKRENATSKAHLAQTDTLLCPPRPDWHAQELPKIPISDNTKTVLPKTQDELHRYATSLLESENESYTTSHLSDSASHKFLSTIMASGTLEDKVSALTLLVQESPLHTMKAFENLIGLAKKRNRNQALMAIAALKDLLGQGVVLPGDRKLKAFGKQPGLLACFQKRSPSWAMGDALPSQLQKSHLVLWAFEDWLKKMYFELLQVLEGWCSDEVEYARSRAITYVWELLRDKPEQEENLLRLLVNKLGDTDKKIASRASYLLLQLETTHPAMKDIIVQAIESECLFRPGQSSHAKYYAIITLNQTILSMKEQEVANKLLGIYFSLFVQLLKPAKQEKAEVKLTPNGGVQGGGGKPGKMAAKKAIKAAESTTVESELCEKMTAQVLTGVNRAFPFAKTDDAAFEGHMDTIFRVTHSANFNTSVQALMLIQQIAATKHFAADRFYRTLYESLLDPRLLTSSKQILYLNLLYRSLKADVDVRRVQAFVKRLLQIITLHEPPFICGVLYLISELEITFPSIRNMYKQGEEADSDEEEHFVDAPEDENETANASAKQPSRPARVHYDPTKRDPQHANAAQSSLWDILPFIAHFHPSVSLFAECLLLGKPMPPKPDPTLHTLIHFLDRFVYRNARSKQGSTRGISIMQPLAGSTAVDLLIKQRDDGRSRVPLNNETFWRKKVENVAADEVFFHSYFNQTGKGKTKKARKGEKGVGSDEEGDEEEIWKALVDSKPDIEGDEDDDDLDMDGLESAYDRSDDDDEDDHVIIADGPDDDDDPDGRGEDIPSDDEEEGILDLDSDEDAMLGDEENLPSDVEVPEPLAAQSESKGQPMSSKARREKKRKLKHLPTFASAEDYAKLLDAEVEEG
ncbi:RNA-binding ribosome biosynthesis protein mak21 [Elasticomyces elasticus]|nr:RNA-binding ribosome biosynthesis protein mak21 [Elasticomyces elasticus]